jgi:hypothetical protein
MPFSQIVRNKRDRRSFVGGSDARIIMGSDEAALIRLWREKRGEAEPEDLSGNLIVQLGLVTEALNRHWYERNTGRQVRDVQSGSSYLAQNDLRAHFGLGQATRAERLEIRWPSGIRQVLKDVAADQFLKVDEPH